MDPKYLRVASDLHLEAFSSRKTETLVNDFLPEDPRDAESVLILAGDICSEPELLIDFIKHVEKRFFKVHFVPGNHEYYRHNYDRWNEIVSNMAAEKLENTEFVAGGVQLDEYYRDDGSDHFRIISGTLWGDGGKSLFEKGAVGWYLNDFRLIGKNFDEHWGERLFTVDDMIALNQSQRNMMECFLSDQEWKGKTIMMSHHLPSYSLCHPRFGTDANGGFASDCDLLIEVYKPDVWIHGHTHDTLDTKISDTRIVCNPVGYRGEWKTEFNTYAPKFIEI